MTAASTWAEVRGRLDAAPMSRVQVQAVAITVLLSALDGYDVLSMTFAAPAISAGWHIGRTALGAVLSSGLAGMAAGSLLLAPLADRWGRRPLVFLSLALMAAGSLLCATATSLPWLAGWRVVTGLGIGTCVAVINPVAAEFANARRRSLALAAMAMGYPGGGLAGGLLAGWLLRSWDWPAIFVAGFIAALLLLPLVAVALPESPAFLGARSDGGARLNEWLLRCGQAPVVVVLSTRASNPRGYRGVFAAGQRGRTLRLTLVNLLSAAVIYYLLSWLPQMVTDAGFTPANASLASVVANLVGILGGVAVGAGAMRTGPKPVTALAIAALGCASIAFGRTPPVYALLLVASGACGFCIFAASAGFYATLGQSFDDAERASGAGFVIGVGRISSAIAPLAAGRLFAAGLGRFEVSAAFGLAALFAALVLATLQPKEVP